MLYINAYYYFGYGFKAATYLDISEILLLSFVDVGQILDDTLIIVIVLIVLITVIHKLAPKVPMNIDEWMLSVVFGMLLTEFLPENFTWRNAVGVVTALTGFFISKYYKVNFPQYSGVLSLVVLGLFESGYGNVKKIKKYHYSFGTTLMTEKDTIKSDLSFYYAGKTRNYVFWYNEKDSAITVIPISDVKKLIIHNGEPDTKPLNLPTKKGLQQAPIIAIDTTKKIEKK